MSLTNFHKWNWKTVDNTAFEYYLISKTNSDSYEKEPMVEGQALSKVPELRKIRPCGPNLDEERRRKSFSSRGRQATSFTSS